MEVPTLKLDHRPHRVKRHIDIPGGYNIRDIGGYTTRDGRTIKWRKIFRAGLLTHIKDEGEDLMRDLQLRSICDFRAPDEQAANPDKWYLLDQLNRYSFPIGDGRPDKLHWLKAENLQDGDHHHLTLSNRSYVRQHPARFKAFFELLLNEANYPLLYHCTAGKDRTGFATVLLLSALGVDWDQIIADYLLTNQYLEAFAEATSQQLAIKSGIPQHLIKSIFQARMSFLKGATDAISSDHGSINIFLREEIGIGEAEKSQLRKILLEEA